jgi:membrane associated rhomboid family serine protease
MIPIRTTAPTRYPPFVTWALIAVNCLVFFVQLGLTPAEYEEFLVRFALIPARYSPPITYAEPLTLGDYIPFISMMFLHSGWLHLILNMWMLWLFGPAVEDRLGHGRFLLFYLGCGIAASLAQMASDPISAIPSLGASGAIAGILGCTMSLFPLSRVIVVVPILFIPLFFEVHAVVFIGIWFLLQILQGMATLLEPSEGGVAWWAHIGGFVAGLLIGPLLHRPERRYRIYQPDEGILGFDTWGRR